MSSRAFGLRGPRLPHLTAGKGGVAGEVDDLRKDVEAAAVYAETFLQPMMLEEFTNLAAADVDAIKLSIATAATLRTFSGADLDGVVGEDEMVPPRNPTVTSTTNAHVTAVTVVFRGKIRDDRGQLVDQSVDVLITAGGGVTDAGVKALSIVEEIEVPAMGGGAGALEFGFGIEVGLKAELRSAAGLPVVVQQITDGAVVTTGTFTAAATAAPHGTWAPATAANGTHDYALLYVPDLR